MNNKTTILKTITKATAKATKQIATTIYKQIDNYANPPKKPHNNNKYCHKCKAPSYGYHYCRECYNKQHQKNRQYQRRY